MSHVRTSLVTLSLLAGLGLGGCSGQDPEGDPRGAAACSPGDGQALRVLADDRSALPADNWVPVLATREGYRDTLALLDQASRGLSAEDLQSVLASTEEGRDAALDQAAADVAEGEAAGEVVRLSVAQDATSRAVGDYYRAALERLGAKVTLERGDLGPTLDALPDDDRPAAWVVLTGLAGLGALVGADLPVGSDASAQVQAVATAALERELAMGSTAAATGGAQVLVPDAFVSSAGLVTISDLAAICDDALVAVAGDDPAAAEAVAEAYGLRVGPQVDDPADAFTDSAGAVAVVTAVVTAGS